MILNKKYEIQDTKYKIQKNKVDDFWHSRRGAPSVILNTKYEIQDTKYKIQFKLCFFYDKYETQGNILYMKHKEI